MKKICLICATLLAGLSLAGCNNLASQQAHKSSSSSSSVKVIKHHIAHKHHKKQTAKKDKNKKQESSAVSTSKSNQQVSSQQQSVQRQNNQAQGQTTQQSRASNNNTSQQGSNSINSAQDAVNAARAKYGDENGYIHWNYMIDGETGQPIRNQDGSYFVKGTANDGTMTGTQYSINVNPDGTMTSN